MAYEFSISKQESNTWRVRSGLEWAFITTDENTGVVMAYSSFGCFGYIWPPKFRNDNLYEFLYGCDGQYTMKKMAGSDFWVFDHDKTIENIKRLIRQGIRDGIFTAEKARECYTNIDLCYGEEIFYGYTGDLIGELFGWELSDLSVYVENPQAVGFYNCLFRPWINNIMGADENAT